MSRSEKDAIAVALDRLGIPRTPTGTGAVVRRVIEDTPADGVLGVADVDHRRRRPAGRDRRRPRRASSPCPGRPSSSTSTGYDGQPRQESVVLAPRPDDPTDGFLGVERETRDFDPGAPFPDQHRLGRVGGPSAGLAFTLAILDVLTEGELTGGRRIAVTGTIGRDGTVGVVGGVAQKSAAAADVGRRGHDRARPARRPPPSGSATTSRSSASPISRRRSPPWRRIGGDPLPAPSCPA